MGQSFGIAPFFTAFMNATWRYHRDGRAVIVRSREELEALGGGWFDSPKKAAAAIEEPKTDADSIEEPPADEFTPDRDEAGKIIRRGRRGKKAE